MEFDNAKIIVFAKAPITGTVKTRLIPDIGPQAATALHKELVLHTLAMLDDASLCPVELWASPDMSDPFFIECQQRYAVTLHNQSGAGLGERMHHALSQSPPNSTTILIGSDIPGLSVDYLCRAITALSRGSEWVLGPAEDGGYVLVGCRQSDYQFFDGVEWGTDAVLSQTLSNAAEMDAQVHLLESLWDLDNYVDLQRWRDLQGG